MNLLWKALDPDVDCICFNNASVTPARLLWSPFHRFRDSARNALPFASSVGRSFITCPELPLSGDYAKHSMVGREQHLACLKSGAPVIALADCAVLNWVPSNQKNSGHL